MNWKKLATAALGIGAIITGTLIPATGVYLIPVGAGLVGWVIPTPFTKAK